MQLTAVQFRDRYDGEGMLQHFREVLIIPQIEKLRHLRPLSPVWNPPYGKTVVQ